MNLQTKIPLEKTPKKLIDYKSNVLLLGSCFSENIGKKLTYYKFKNVQNPFGILFHPKAIEALISDAVKDKEYSESDVFYHNEQWHCFNAHSKLSHSYKEDLLIDLNKNVRLTHKQIKESTHIIITIGTAWVYRFVETGKVVANCHKVPQKQFNKTLLSVDAICESLNNITDLVRKVNDKVSIIFTVSPVRHLKDGFIENTKSKAHLITAIHRYLNQETSIVDGELFYFPSYEIMMDELRDYRFYKEDMIHPNQTAINYIWEAFKNVWILESVSKTMEDINTIQKGLKHKPFNPKSQAHQKFLQNLQDKIKNIELQFPNIVF
ncbi:GSCFA domain-containing protein [Flavivirga aquatica]|uniref:GSCFA domain-containing protein n=1 Tax=Flavivirga aquatica TaxID=1849968 RepID=A0A1E5SJ09_9FLAO|nr:GSCFA domain-containing protein [Flavivirga aquatica]OEJ99091.1 GSCFA domain-containing protein [Flavivirga aquatica]